MATKPAAVDLAGANPNQLTPEEEAAVVGLRTRIEESKKRGVHVAAKYTDFELAQFIIIGKCDVEKSYKRFKNFHNLRIRHNFDEMTEERAMACTRSVGAFIGVGGTDNEGRAIFCMRGAGIDPNSIDVGAAMYCFVLLFKKLNPDIASTRRGVVFCADMAGFGWSNFSLKMEKEFSSLYQEGYPVRMAGMYLVDPPWWINALMKIMRTFLKKKLMDRMLVLYDEGVEQSDPTHLYTKCPLKQLHAIMKGPITESFGDTMKKCLAAKAAQEGGGSGAAAAE